MKFCPHCGKQLQFEKAEICPACGCRVEESRGPEAANTFNSVVAIILIAILAVLCLIAASIVLSAPDSAKKTIAVDTLVSPRSSPGDSSMTVVWKTMDDWDSWEHAGSWSGSASGPSIEVRPRIIGGHGEYGTNISLYAGSTESSIWRTFSDPSGNGWNTLTFVGELSPCDTPGGRWIKIEVNDKLVYQAVETQVPPGNGEVFSIPVHFSQAKTVRVKISNGQNPAWWGFFGIEYYSLRLSSENSVQV